MLTDSGLTGFDGAVFENYTTGNGLLSYSINGITTTRNDTLWIVSDLGASKFDEKLLLIILDKEEKILKQIVWTESTF